MDKARRVSVVTRSKGRRCHHFRYVKVVKGSAEKNTRAGGVKWITRFLSAMMLSIKQLHCSKKALLSLSELSFLSVFIGSFCTDNLSFTNTFWINKDGHDLDELVLESRCITANRFSNSWHFCTSAHSEFWLSGYFTLWRENFWSRRQI